jgi:hypothetical protein
MGREKRYERVYRKLEVLIMPRTEVTYCNRCEEELDWNSCEIEERTEDGRDIV